MKKSWRIIIIVAALGITLGCATGATAQEPPIAGGYSETSNSDPQVVSAANYAIRAQGQRQGVRISLLSIRHAEVQVVAGLNYMLGLRVSVKGKAYDVTAVVYQNLQRKYSLSTWKASTPNAAAALPGATIEQLAKSLADAYMAKELGRLDAEHVIEGKVKITIEHSLAGDNDKQGTRTKVFKSFGDAEQWLRSQQLNEDVPARESRPLQRCRKGVCTYNFDDGILHNHLYLQEIGYGYLNGRPYIKTLFLLDGD